ncbi:MAG: tetratricopeptide repeat protein [Alphaproteobacteria bacterium]|nr:tetratricopeptide repeat protein [Alphaproteobacteria bacterium]
MTDIFSEIEQEVRQDNLLALWKRYGPYIIGAASAVVLATAAYVLWQNYENSRLSAIAKEYSTALNLNSEERSSEAEEILNRIGEQEKSGYGILARLTAAHLLASRNKDEAIALYQQLIAESSIDPIFRDLAVLRMTLLQLGSQEEQTLIDQLTPLTRTDNPWRISALEIVGSLEYSLNNKVKAVEIYKLLVQAPDAPPTLRKRAHQMLMVLSAAGENIDLTSGDLKHSRHQTKE